MNIGNLKSSVLLDTTNFNRGVNKTVQGFKNMGTSSDRFKARMHTLGSTMGTFAKRAGIALVAAGTAFTVFTKKALDFADAIGKTADASAMSTDKIQELRYAGKLAGIEIAQMDKAMIKFTKTVGELKDGSGTLYTILNKTDKAFIDQLNTLNSADEKFDAYLVYLSKIKDESRRTALAAAAFGARVGPKMNIMIQKGLPAYEAVIQKAHRLGLVLNEELIRNAETANDDLTTLADVVKINLTAAVLELAPKISEIATKMTEWISKNKELISQKIEKIAIGIKNGIVKIYDIIVDLIDLYNSHPVLFTGGAGLIGYMLFGPTGAILAMIGPVLELMNKAEAWSLRHNPKNIGGGGEIGKPIRIKITKPGSIIPTPKSSLGSPGTPIVPGDDSLARKNTAFGAEGQGPGTQNIESWRKAGEEAAKFNSEINNTPGFLDLIKDGMTNIGTTFESVLVEAFSTGEMSLKGMAEAFAKSLRIMAASLTARHLMEALSSTAMGFYYLAIKDAKGASEAFAAAKINAMAAATFGSFVVGSGLAGMAEDGITNIPDNGTWLLHKNERVLDANTNADLKQFLAKGGGSTQITQNIEINGGDEESVKKALPLLKQQIEQVVNSNISNNGSIRRTILARV